MFDTFYQILNRILKYAHLNAEDVLHGMYEIEILSYMNTYDSFLFQYNMQKDFR